MPSPFPGMDPYLESPDIWPDVYAKLITEIQNALNPALRPNYVARVELRVYVTDPDDPAIDVIVPDLRVEESRSPAAKKAKHMNGAGIALAEPEIIPYQFDEEIKEARLEIRHRKSGGAGDDHRGGQSGQQDSRLPRSGKLFGKTTRNAQPPMCTGWKSTCCAAAVL